MARPDSRALLPMIRCPTLVVCGADDQVTPVALSREIATLIPGARHVEIAHCGHVATLEQPDIVNDALGAWLSDCLARRDGIPAVVAPP
jgi:pimeloyl-ACP methyl ester carboxylesterase